jgi:hypothetical protein
MKKATACPDRLGPNAIQKIETKSGVFSFLLSAPQWTTDQCHPTGDGMHVQAENFGAAVMDSWIKPTANGKGVGGAGGARL